MAHSRPQSAILYESLFSSLLSDIFVIIDMKSADLSSISALEMLSENKRLFWSYLFVTRAQSCISDIIIIISASVRPKTEELYASNAFTNDRLT